MSVESQPRIVPPGRGWLRSTAVAVWAGLAVIAVVLLWRRLAGGFTAELTPLPACTFATLAAVAGVVAWLLDACSRPPLSRTLRASGTVTSPAVAVPAGRWILPAAATLAPPLLVGLALWPAGSSGTMAYLTLLMLLAAASLWALEQFAPRECGDSSPLPAVLDTPLSVPQSGDEPPHSRVAQWSRRAVRLDGSEHVEGGIRVPFAAGQKHATVHLAFTPPLQGVPAVECEPLDASDVELKVAAVYAYGARLEARRNGAGDGPLEVEIGYTAETPAGHASE